MLAAGTRLLAAAAQARAYGLAGAHLGLVEPVIVVSVAADQAERDYRVMYNPRAVVVAGDLASGTEGSVSMPGIEVAVLRPIWAEIAYQTAEGQEQAVRLEGFPARVALHELDQMEGQFFLSRVSRVKRDAAIRRFGKSLRLSG